MEKRWWLWEWGDSADDRVYDFSDELAKYKAKRCTEVRLVPVGAVVCEQGSREWAVVLAMRGKAVKHETSERVYTDPAHVLGRALAEYNWCELPAEEPVKTLEEAIACGDADPATGGHYQDGHRPDDHDGLVTLRVAPDSLEAAISGTRRGERWVVKDRPWLQLRTLPGGDIQEINGGGGDGDGDYAMARIEPSGWHRVEDPLKCPACGAEAHTHEYAGKWTVSCSRCQLRFGSGSAYPFTTESEAREAFRRMGGKR